MSDLYQPIVIRELLVGGGVRTRDQLARTLAQYDVSVLEYYKKAIMRWPKITLAKHSIAEYDRERQLFRLLNPPEDESTRREAVSICDRKISEWLEKKAQSSSSPAASTSVRYQVLKAAGGRCALCGIPSSLRPIDIDHVIPRAKANRHNKVFKDGVWMDVDSLANLQALCFTCNRAKRDGDETDFRRTKKLIRDKIPEMMKRGEREPRVKRLAGSELTTALYEKLIEEHAEFISELSPTKKLEELIDMVEVILTIARQFGRSQEELMALVREKREARGGFLDGFLYLGEITAEK